ncbi:hypothetical protein ACFV5N_11775 [Streptomyces sp. NPDC059853]|uniref:hypothetical protein n=1 Tax=Streptomyces sp. NPDC059853 TaxID=3346973 RepID=UPI003650DB4B
MSPADPTYPSAPSTGTADTRRTSSRRRRAARHREQVAAAAQTSLRLLAAAAGATDEADADAETDESRAERAAAHAEFRARLRAARDSRARGAAVAAAGRETAASGPGDPSPADATDPTAPRDGGRFRNQRTTLAPPAADVASELGERPVSGSEKNGANPGTAPDPGAKYERPKHRRQQRMRQLDDARLISTLPSLIRCGRDPLGGAVTIQQRPDGEGGFIGLFKCGSVWACPECSPVVRAERARVMEAAAHAWTEAGRGIAMATLTSRHGQYNRLAAQPKIRYEKGKPVINELTGEPEVARDEKGKPVMIPGQLEATAAAWRRMLTSTWWRNLRARYDLAGATRAIEVTRGNSGWHTHIHAVLWFMDPVTDEIAKQLQGELYTRWVLECAHAKLGKPNRARGVRVDPARQGSDGAADIAKYLVKVQDKDPNQTDRTDVEPNLLHRPNAKQASRLAAAKARRRQYRAEHDQALADYHQAINHYNENTGDGAAWSRYQAADARRRKARAGQAEADAEIAEIREEIGQAAASRALGNELLRADTKRAKRAGRTSGEILRDALAATAKARVRLLDARREERAAKDAAVYAKDEARAKALARAEAAAARIRRALADIGTEREVQLWREYEQGTRGHRMLTWSGSIKDLLADLGVTELDRNATDVVTEEEKAGRPLLQAEPAPFRQHVTSVPGRRGQVAAAVAVATASVTEGKALDVAGEDVRTAAVAAARTAVAELLEGWGLVRGADFWGDEDARYDRSLNTSTGEIALTAETITHAPLGPVPTTLPAPPRRRTRWQSADELHSTQALLGIRPQDAVRPEMAARRAAGLPVARDITRG